MRLPVIHHVHGRAGGAEINLVAAQMHVIFRRLAVQGDVPGGLVQRFFHQPARQQQAAIASEFAPGFGD